MIVASSLSLLLSSLHSCQMVVRLNIAILLLNFRLLLLSYTTYFLVLTGHCLVYCLLQAPHHQASPGVSLTLKKRSGSLLPEHMMCPPRSVSVCGARQLSSAYVRKHLSCTADDPSVLHLLRRCAGLQACSCCIPLIIAYHCPLPLALSYVLT